MSTSDPKLPLCFSCQHRVPIAWSAMSACESRNANVTANPFGECNDWFDWPYQFDPAWLLTCDGYTPLTKRSPDHD